MSRLSDVLPSQYPPIRLNLGDKAEAFVRRLAAIAGTTPDELATNLLAGALETEASLLVDILNRPAMNAKRSGPGDIQADAAPHIDPVTAAEFITDADLVKNDHPRDPRAAQGSEARD